MVNSCGAGQALVQDSRNPAASRKMRDRGSRTVVCVLRPGGRADFMGRWMG